MRNYSKILVPFLALTMLFVATGCSYKPANVQGVSNFDPQKYMGVWYEIARFDFRFEKDLDNVSAMYTLNDKGDIEVLNSGYNYKKHQWQKAQGLAKSVGDENVAELKVSFFGPFYSGYNVLSIDDNYTYALVGGKDLDYLWILSREKQIPEHVKTDFLKKASALGYDTDKLIWVKQDKSDNPFLHVN